MSDRNDLLKQIRKLKKELKAYKVLSNKSEINREYKDTLFKFIFGSPENRLLTLALYNALNGTDYKDPNELKFNTIDEVLYLKMKNDISFLIHFELNLWEHQSTFNPNMPMRFLRYAEALYEKFIATSEYYEYSSSLQKIPTPKCLCFYNGTEEQPERTELLLSDAYEGDGDIEVKVTMLNINFGKNRKLLDACKPLYEYSWLVESIRRYQKEETDLEAAVERAVDDMPEDFIIKEFIVANRAEVKVMLLTEYNEEKVLKMERKEGWAEGKAEGRAEGLSEGIAVGRNEGKVLAFADLVSEGILTLSDAARRAGMTEDEFIAELRKNDHMCV